MAATLFVGAYIGQKYMDASPREATVGGYTAEFNRLSYYIGAQFLSNLTAYIFNRCTILIRKTTRACILSSSDCMSELFQQNIFSIVLRQNHYTIVSIWQDSLIRHKFIIILAYRVYHHHIICAAVNNSIFTAMQLLVTEDLFSGL